MNCKPEGLFFLHFSLRLLTLFPPAHLSLAPPFIHTSRCPSWLYFVPRISFIYQAFLSRVRTPTQLPIYSRTERKYPECLGSYSIIPSFLRLSKSIASLPPMIRGENCRSPCLSRGYFVLTIITMLRSLYKMGRTLVRYVDPLSSGRKGNPSSFPSRLSAAGREGSGKIYRIFLANPRGGI